MVDQDNVVKLRMTTDISRYEKARAALAEARNFDEVKDIRDKAVAMRTYAEQAKDTELIEHATEIRLRAERRAGEMLKDMEKAKGGQPYQSSTGSLEKPVEKPATLSDIGITKKQSFEWQGLARMPSEEFEATVIEAKDKAAKRPPPPSTTPTREEAKEVIRAHKAVHGVYPSVREATKETGKSRIVVEPALAAVIAEDRVAPSTHTFTKAQDAQVEARVKVRLRELEKEFDARVTAENKRQIDILFPDLEELRRQAELNERYYREQIERKALFTEAEYTDILFCTQNEHVSAERRRRAFIAFQPKKLQLTGKK